MMTVDGPRVELVCESLSHLHNRRLKVMKLVPVRYNQKRRKLVVGVGEA